MARNFQMVPLNDEIISKISDQDYSQITKSIEGFLADFLSESKADGYILGLSGGIDSSVIAALCARTSKKNTLALIMPDSEISPKSETEDALKLVDQLGIEYKLLDIMPIVKEYSKYVEPDERARGNLRARIRSDILYYYANMRNYLVLGSSDKSEWLVGYFTKFGDGASDITPIISLYKLQVRGLAEYIGVPQQIISKKSSPHLWKNHLAEEEIGLDYEEIDSILYCIFDKKMTAKDTAETCGIKPESVERILELNKNSQHKRDEPARLH